MSDAPWEVSQCSDNEIPIVQNRQVRQRSTPRPLQIAESIAGDPDVVPEARSLTMSQPVLGDSVLSADYRDRSRHTGSICPSRAWGASSKIISPLRCGTGWWHWDGERNRVSSCRR
jgi:hypothetical protein